MVLAIVFILSLTFSAGVCAAKYRGYAPVSENKILIYSETIERMEELKSEFLISITGYAAFYSFPKDKQREVVVRNFLKSRQKSKKKLHFEVDAMTAKILSISDAQ